MKNRALKILFVFGTIMLFMGVHYSDFNIVSNTDKVILSWHTTSEGNLRETEVERKIVNGTFTVIGSVPAKGDNSSYTYIDENAFKVEDGVYVYRLKFVNKDGTYSYSSEKTITHLTSITKKTWGSIKALFR